MQSFILFLGLLIFAAPVLSVFCPPYGPETPKTFCNHERSVEIFSATFYTAMLVKYDFDVVGTTATSGKGAAKTEHKIILEELQKQGLSYADAEEDASTASRPLAELRNVHLTVYLEKIAHAIGEFYNQSGHLNCATALTLALNYFSLVVERFAGLDDHLFASYQQATIQGLVDLVEENKLDKEASAKKLNYLFAKEFRMSSKDVCPVL